jgi:1-deoxy-D-xylulose-5-phosphate reductoisomerase
MSHRAAQPIGLVVLGSTGTIGRHALDVAARRPERIRVVALAAGSNGALLAEQVATHRPSVAALADEAAAGAFRRAAPADWKGDLLTGPDAAVSLSAWPQATVIVNAMVGAAGLKASLAALAHGRRLALANKESLVMAGYLLRRAARAHGGELLPVDSEHSAIFQCLSGLRCEAVRRIVLTASGGPLRTWDAGRLAHATPADALRHPTWRMGRRITVDSATLFNKGMEVIEARWLFDLELEQIDVWIHPQSIVHGLVETRDGSLLAQLSVPDMRLPIQLALSHPERWEPAVERCDLAALGHLTFEPADETRFPCLALARQAARMGGVAPAAANAADEVLVAAFLAGRLPFPAIAAGIASVLAGCPGAEEPELDAVLAADQWARAAAARFAEEQELPGSGGRSA